MIAIENATVRRRSHILAGPLSLALEPSRITVIIGPNGAGKSTLMKLFSGEFRPSTGNVSLDGKPMQLLPPRHLASRRAVLAQANDASFGFTVRELAALGLRMIEANHSPGDRAKLVQSALAQVGLAEFESRPIDRLSGGERQRAHLARVLVQLRAGEGSQQPATLLLDEPIAAQDIAHQLLVLDIARQHAAGGGAVAIVLHDLNWAAHIADRLVVMHRGRIYASDTPANVLTRTMLADVFKVDLQPGTLPADCPFVLPQLASARPDDFPSVISTTSSRRLACTLP